MAAVPTKKKTWSFAVNQSWGAGLGGEIRETMVRVKEALLAAPGMPWTQIGSATSLQAGMDGLNRTVGVGYNQARWDVVRSPAGLFVLFHYVSNGQVGIYMSLAGFTGGSTAARPTATDETSAPLTQSFSVVNNYTAARRAHVCNATDGSATIVLITGGTSQATFYGGLVFGQLVDAASEEPIFCGLTTPLDPVQLRYAGETNRWTAAISAAGKIQFPSVVVESHRGMGNIAAPYVYNANGLSATWPIYELGFETHDAVPVGGFLGLIPDVHAAAKQGGLNAGDTFGPNDNLWMTAGGWVIPWPSGVTPIP